MAATVRDLLAVPSLALTLLTSEADLPPEALNGRVTWVHSSDLPDPTPFLQQGHVLLLTGTWFSTDPPLEEVRAYVARLAARGVVLLGFGAGVVRAVTPKELVEACREMGLPLVEVPYRVPFIAIAQAAAELVAEEANRRRNWAFVAQRAISLAALQPDGLSATLRELARQLDSWVALIDAGGGMERSYPPQGVPTSVLQQVRREAVAMLARGRRSSGRIETDGHDVHLRTLGAGGALRGVLAVRGRGRPDEADQHVVNNVVALAGLALEQNHDLDRARALLRSGLWHALVSGEIELVRPVAQELWGALPDGPVRIALVGAADGAAQAIGEFLELQAAARREGLFHAPVPDGIALCLGRSVDALPATLADDYAAPVGVSDPVGLDEVARGVRQAAQALERAREAGGGVVEFATIAGQGVQALLTRVDARDVARTVLEPLRRHDERHGTALVSALRLWLEENGHLERSAAGLGIHRHTLRAWLQTCQSLLGRDLDQFSARADLWVTLLAAEGGADQGGATPAAPPAPVASAAVTIPKEP